MYRGGAGFARPNWRDFQRRYPIGSRMGAAVGAAGLAKGVYSLYGVQSHPNIFRNKTSAKVEAKSAVRAYKRKKAVVKAVSKYAKKQTPYNKLKHQVRDISRRQKDGVGTLVYRSVSAGVQISNANTAGNETMTLNTTTDLETVLAQLRYYNPSSPATLVTADFTSGTFAKSVLFKYSSAKVTCRNNYQVPCNVRCWVLTVKTDTSISPETAWANGVADQSNGSINDIHMYPSDSPQFSDFWKIDKEYEFYLNPGQQKNFSINSRNVDYDPSVTDSQTATYQKANRCRALMFNVSGAIAHDSVAAQYGCIGCGVDFLIKKTYIVEYEAGANIKYVYLLNSLDSFTNGALVSNKAVADNQAYSVS